MAVCKEIILNQLDSDSDGSTIEANTLYSNEDNSKLHRNTKKKGQELNLDKNNTASEEESDNEMDITTEEERERNDSEQSLNENSDSENENVGNSGWADAMTKVLNTNLPKTKNFILSKAKKDSDIKVKDKSQEIQLVDESGNITNVKKLTPEPIKKTLKQKRKEMIEKQKQKAAWESMGRVKPDIIKDKERERELIRIATRGVVHLFNTVAKHQKNMQQPTDKKAKQKQSLGAVKGSFMDILKGHSKNQQDLKDDPVTKKVKQEETWSILKDNFMMGAEMKDWDKESDDE